jgi:hypothetical protein
MQQIFDQLKTELNQVIADLEQLWQNCQEDETVFLEAIVNKWEDADPYLFAFLTSKMEATKKGIDWSKVKKGKNRPNVPVNKDDGE